MVRARRLLVGALTLRVPRPRPRGSLLFHGLMVMAIGAVSLGLGLALLHLTGYRLW